jgi:hypothetical protein
MVLPALLAPSAELNAQTPSVSSAVLRWPSRAMPSAADSGDVRLILKIANLPTERLKALQFRDIVVVDANNRTYRAQAFAFGPHDPLTPENIADRRYIFLVPRGQTRFELRLPALAPVPFIATVSLEKT